MDKLEIELKKEISHGNFTHNYYRVKTKELTTIVSVLAFENEPAFVHSIGESEHRLFQNFKVWNHVRINVLDYHNKLKEEN